jgi:hypothetical protein
MTDLAVAAVLAVVGVACLFLGLLGIGFLLLLLFV